MMPKILFLIGSLSYVLTAHALDNQFICEFGASVKVSSTNINQPKTMVDRAKNDKYTFMLDSERPLKASYINLNNGLRIPLHVIKSGKTYTFVESAHGGNLFAVTIFTSKKVNGGYNAIWSFHNEDPTDVDDFFAQSITIGRCM